MRFLPRYRRWLASKVASRSRPGKHAQRSLRIEPQEDQTEAEVTTNSSVDTSSKRQRVDALRRDRLAGASCLYFCQAETSS